MSIASACTVWQSATSAERSCHDVEWSSIGVGTSPRRSRVITCAEAVLALNFRIVMAGHSRSENGFASARLWPATHVSLRGYQDVDARHRLGMTNSCSMIRNAAAAVQR